MSNLQSQAVRVRVFYPKKARVIGEENSVGYVCDSKIPTEDEFYKHYALVLNDVIYPDCADLCERLFGMLNEDHRNPLSSKTGQSKLRSLGASHTSMSVGDIIVINRTPYITRNEGFEMIQDFEVDL